MTIANPIYLADISSHQHGLRIASLKDQDYHAVAIRATGGLNANLSIWRDTDYRDFSAQAQAAGMLEIAYAFLVERPVKMQVDAFLQVVGTLKNKAIMLDFEQYGPAPRFSPSNATLKGFIANLRNRGILKPIIVYSGVGYWVYYGTPSGPLSNYGAHLIAWDAFYPLGSRRGYGAELYRDARQYGWGNRWGQVEPTIWQFTGTGRVDGYANDIDLNAFRGTMQQLESYAADAGGTDDPDEPTEPIGPTEPPRETGDWPPYAPPKARILPVRPGTYEERHPTRYVWRTPDVKAYLYRLFRFYREISINTYVEHPGREISPNAYGRDTTSADIWGRAGRNDPIDPELGDAIRAYLLNDPDPPYVAWLIYKQRVYTPNGRGGFNVGPFGTDPFSWHRDHLHVTFAGPYRRLT